MTSWPSGLAVVLDDEAHRLDDGRVLLGGEPGQLVRLQRGALLDRLAAADADGPLRALARRLVDSGLAHPRPAPVPAPTLDVTVVVPVRDRVDELAACLRALGREVPVVVVDDGSRDPRAVARVVERSGARLVAQEGTGPAGARNAGIALADTALVALLDSDCRVPDGWLAGLVGHFDDPAVGAVAPRVLAASGGRSVLARYAAARGPLDMGPREARVRPGGRVPYVPTAALVVRRSALDATAPFDTALRFGEDVDRVWRLHDAGWTVRYDPATVVRHAEPDRWVAWLRRRHAYGTSAAPLAARHPGRLAPLVLSPWPTAAGVLLACRRPGAALVVAAVPTARLVRLLHRTGLPWRTSAATGARVTARSLLSAAAGLGGGGTVVTGPVLSLLLLARRTRVAAAVALLVPPLLEHRTRRPDLGPVRWTALRLVDDLAYASGVWRSCVTARSIAPLRPRTSRPT